MRSKPKRRVRKAINAESEAAIDALLKAKFDAITEGTAADDEGADEAKPD